MHVPIANVVAWGAASAKHRDIAVGLIMQETLDGRIDTVSIPHKYIVAETDDIHKALLNFKIQAFDRDRTRNKNGGHGYLQVNVAT